MFNAITTLCGENTSNGRNRGLFYNPLNPAIGLSDSETPPGQGCKCKYLLTTTTMYPKRKRAAPSYNVATTYSPINRDMTLTRTTLGP